MLPALSRIDNPIIQAHYLKQLAQTLDIAEDKVNEALQKVKSTVRTSQYRQKFTAEPTDSAPKINIEEYLLALILQSDDVSLGLESIINELNLNDLENLAVKKILQLLITYVKQHQQININQFAQTLPAEQVAVFDRLYLVDLSSLLGNPKTYRKELVNAVKAVKQSIYKKKIKNLTLQIKQAESENDENKLKSLTETLNQTTMALKQVTQNP